MDKKISSWWGIALFPLPLIIMLYMVITWNLECFWPYILIICLIVFALLYAFVRVFKDIGVFISLAFALLVTFSADWGYGIISEAGIIHMHFSVPLICSLYTYPIGFWIIRGAKNYKKSFIVIFASCVVVLLLWAVFSLYILNGIRHF